MIQQEIDFTLALRGLRRQSAPYPDDRLGHYEEVFSGVVASLAIGDRAVIRLAFADATGLLAFCFARQLGDIDLRVVVLSSGAIPYLHNFFQYITSRYDCLPSLGISTRERNLPHRGQLHYSVDFVEILRRRGLLKDITAKDPYRLDIGCLMGDFAVKFLLFHELGHCVDGHLDPATMGFDETDTELDGDYRTVLARHTLEMDADAYAISCILDNLVRTRTPEFLQTWPGFEKLPTHNAHLLPALFAVLMLFRFWPSAPSYGPKLRDLLVGSHPVPSVRSNLVMANFFSHYVSKELLGKAAVLKGTYAAAHIEALRSCTCLTGMSVSRWFSGASQEGFDAQRRYLNLLLREWHKLRPELEPRALITLAPLDMEALSLHFDD